MSAICFVHSTQVMQHLSEEINIVMIMMRACTLTLNIILLPAVVASNFGNEGC